MPLTASELYPFHPRRPFQETQQFAEMLPNEPKEHSWCDLVGVPTPVSFNSPAEIGAAPWPQAVAFARPPEEDKHYFPAEVLALAPVSGVA